MVFKMGKIIIIKAYIIIALIHPIAYADTIVIDRLVAYVDDYAITLSELNMQFEKMSKLSPSITKKEVIESIINKILLINEAKKLRLDFSTDEDLINHYLEIAIRSRLSIKEEEVFDFYKRNVQSAKNEDYFYLKEQIEKYLLEQQFNTLLKKHIDELRRKANIRVFIDYND